MVSSSRCCYASMLMLRLTARTPVYNMDISMQKRSLWRVMLIKPSPGYLTLKNYCLTIYQHICAFFTYSLHTCIHRPETFSPHLKAFSRPYRSYFRHIYGAILRPRSTVMNVPPSQPCRSHPPWPAGRKSKIFTCKRSR